MLLPDQAKALKPFVNIRMKMRGALTIILIALFTVVLNGQEKVNFWQIDSTTYSLYQNGNWKQLLKTGRLALQNDIDYYYLRMRMGIANFSQEKYAFAANHFEKALGFNKNDPAAMYYLYDSYVYSGKQKRANRFSESFYPRQKKELGIDIKPLSATDFYGGYIFSNNAGKNGNTDLLTGGDTIRFGEQLMLGDEMYFHAGLDFNISPSFTFYAGLSYINIQKQTRFQDKMDRYYVSSTVHLPNGGYINNFSKRTELHENTFDGYIRQTELYLNARLQRDRGVSFNLFLNLLFINMNNVDVEYVTYIRQDTLGYDANANRYLMIGHDESDYKFSENRLSFANWVFGFNFQKDFNAVIVDWNATMSRINQLTQFQTSLSATYYPLGSMKLYGTTGVLLFYEPQAELFEDAGSVVFNQAIGFKLTGNLWLEGELIYGNLRNANIKQGSVVYNLPDKTNYSVGLKLYIFVSSHLSFDLIYSYNDKTGNYKSYSKDLESFNQYSTNYQTHNLIGGIKWTF